jgi:hypothetical protein
MFAFAELALPMVACSYSSNPATQAAGLGDYTFVSVSVSVVPAECQCLLVH